jgi:asparagine synthase (glutamine-hydrolysing)
MRDTQGRWLIFNGEIYNFRELRAELAGQGIRFNSSGDTEVLLRALGHWGLDALPRLRGMFAFAWIDPARKQLILARDRYGVKPLVWEHTDNGLRFGSDLFVLDALAGGAKTRQVDPLSVQRYLLLGYVPAPHTIWKGPRKLLPGNYLRMQWSESGPAKIDEASYWKMSELPPAAERTPADEFDRFGAGLREAVGMRLISDVPVGLLLSGGIDSSLVAAAYSDRPGADIPSFTMGFRSAPSDERPFARRIAEHLRLEHADFLAEDEDIAAVFSELWQAFDEPFADSSALPMISLCREIRKHVTVAIGGDGGDEVWCGYPWHRALARVGRGLAMPAALRRLAGFLGRFGGGQWPYKGRVLAAGDRLGAWAALKTGLSDAMAEYLPVAAAPAPVVECFRDGAERVGAVPDILDWACRMDMATYLPDDLMVKADRASMRFGLELREPLLDHAFTAFGLTAPIEARFDRKLRRGKVLARRYLAERLPEALFDRPKQGFTPPLPAWLDGPLRAVKTQAIADLESGRLPGMALPDGVASWTACATRLQDDQHQFLWRMICFSGWARAREIAH